ncbi:hypothetical protein ACXZ9C_11210 [Streptococcus agalactiae]
MASRRGVAWRRCVACRVAWRGVAWRAWRLRRVGVACRRGVAERLAWRRVAVA